MTSRATRTQSPYKHITSRDYSIVEAIWLMRYATTDHISRLFFTPTTLSGCRERLRILFNRGYLKKRPPVLGEHDIYFLGVKGRNYIAKRFNLPKETVLKVTGTNTTARLPNLFMEHDLRLAMLYANLRLQSEKEGLELVWQNTRMLEMQGLGIQPDGHLAVSRAGNTKKAFVEYTAVRTSGDELVGKLDGYHRLYQRLTPRAIWWLTKDKATAEWVGSHASRHETGQYVMVCPYQDRADLLTAPIWTSPVSQGLHAFIKLSIPTIRVNL